MPRTPLFNIEAPRPSLRWGAVGRGGVTGSTRLGALIRAEERALPQPPPAPSGSAVLECVRCYHRYSAADVKAGSFRLETMICSRCYTKMKQLPARLSCFGKGYRASAVECRELCPDKVVCKATCGDN